LRNIRFETIAHRFIPCASEKISNIR